MKHPTTPLRSILVMLTLVAGCSQLPTLSDPWGGQLVASLSGETSLQYSSEAVFRIFRYPGLTYDDFNLISRGIGASSGDRLSMEADGGRLAQGTYPVAVHSGWKSISLLFISGSSDSSEFRDSFTAVEGEVTITWSRSDRLVGHFDVLAVRYCRVPHDRSKARIGSCDRFHPDSTSPTVRIEGSFDVPRVANIIEL